MGKLSKFNFYLTNCLTKLIITYIYVIKILNTKYLLIDNIVIHNNLYKYLY